MNINCFCNASGNRVRKEEGDLDEIYVLGINGETEAVFDADGTAKFFNVLAGSKTISRFIPSASVELLLTNTTLNGNYEALNTITAENNVTITGTATLIAGTSIILKSGFSANSGSNFAAKIETISDQPERYYYLKDHLGSIRVTVDEDGEIVSYGDYDPWGMVLAGRSGNDGFVNDMYKFTGKERDTETGYVYF